MGPKDTPFEGGVFAAKLTFVSSILAGCYCTLFSVSGGNFIYDHLSSDLALRLPAFAIQNEVRPSTVSSKQ